MLQGLHARCDDTMMNPVLLLSFFDPVYAGASLHSWSKIKGPIVVPRKLQAIES